MPPDQLPDVELLRGLTRTTIDGSVGPLVPSNGL
jgi:hypothetical protein